MTGLLLAPPDITTRILFEAGWKTILRLRSVSKAFNELTCMRSLWISIVKFHQDFDIISCAFEFPLSEYTLQELQTIFLRWKRTSLHWIDIGDYQHTSITTLSLPDIQVSQMVLVPGGRWLLLSTTSWNVIFIDLFSSDRRPQTLIPSQVQLGGRKYPCSGDLTINGPSNQVEGRFTLTLGVVFAWLQGGDEEEEDELLLHTVVQGWHVQNTVPVEGRLASLEAKKLTEVAVTDPSSDYDAGFATISRTHLLYYSKKPYLDDNCNSTVLRLHLKPADGINESVEITGSPPHFNTYSSSCFVRFINDSCVVYVRDDKVVILRHNTSRTPPFTTILYSLTIPEFIGSIYTKSHLSYPYRVGATTRLTLYYSDRVCGILIPDECLERQDISTLLSPRVFVLASYLNPAYEVATIASFCGYRHVFLVLGPRKQYVMVEFSWPDDENDDSDDSDVQISTESTSVRFCVNREAEDDGLTEGQLLFVPPPLVSMDEVSGQIVVYDRGAGYVMSLS